MPKMLDKIYQPQLKRLPEYGLLFFDHLQAEYTSEIEEAKADEKKMSLLTAIEVARKDGCLTWKDIYTFDLTLARLLKGERLRSKILTLRSLSITVAPIALGALISFVNSKGWLGLGDGAATLPVVIFAGMVGALVSMHQRIPSSPSEGEPLHNFAVLTHVRFGIFLSPISGGIFAAVLYLMFTSGLMTGVIFPVIATISRPCSVRPMPAPTPTPISTSTQPAPSTTQSTPTPEIQPPFSIIVLLNEFLKETGPCGGSNFALLVVWSFIAGFAERLVPDALNRMVAKSGS